MSATRVSPSAMVGFYLTITVIAWGALHRKAPIVPNSGATRVSAPKGSAAEYPPLPSDDAIREAAYLVARGVRAVAILGSCASTEGVSTRHRLLTLGQAGTVPFVLTGKDEGAVCGYASHAWAIDLLGWARAVAPPLQRDRILGLLLGYSPDAIRSFEELAGEEGR